MSITNYTTFSYHLPFAKTPSNIQLKNDVVQRMQNYTYITKMEIPQQYEKIRNLCIKVTPIALAALATLISSPLWMGASILSSIILGHISWIIPGVSGAILWSECKELTESFEKGCTPIFDYGVAKLAKIYVALSKEFVNQAHTSR